MKKILIIDHLYKIFKNGPAETEVLHDINFSIFEKDFVSIVGPSGSGKSTLLTICGGLQEPTAGKVLFQGEPIYETSKEDLAIFRQRSVGFVFQHPHLITYLTALENVMLPLMAQDIPKAEQIERGRLVLEKVGLAGKEDRMPDQLSGGEQGRVAIARAIISEPSLLLADEPTGNLDSKTGKEIMDLFAALNGQGQTILFITHQLEYTKYGNRSFHILDGRVSEAEVLHGLVEYSF